MMPQHWNPETYRLQAKQWQDKAAALSFGEEHGVCVVIAEAYARLARLIEKRTANALNHDLQPPILPISVRQTATPECSDERGVAD
jgi:hypothetical protein